MAKDDGHGEVDIHELLGFVNAAAKAENCKIEVARRKK